MTVKVDLLEINASVITITPNIRYDYITETKSQEHSVQICPRTHISARSHTRTHTHTRCSTDEALEG